MSDVDFNVELPEYVTPHDLLTQIESFSITERGLQKEIGVSEIGMTCQRCVIRKLAGVEKEQQIGSWRAQLGTYVHAGLADEFEKRYSADGRAIIESSLQVHQYKSLNLRGSCDAFFPNGGRGLVADWKIVGDDTLESVRSGNIKDQYVTQGHLYAFGWEQLGFQVETVAIMFLPANKGNLKRDAVPVSFPYDRAHAIRALAKIEKYIDLAEEIGWDELLRSHQPAKGCLSCRQYVAADNPIHDLTLRK